MITQPPRILLSRYLHKLNPALNNFMSLAQTSQSNFENLGVSPDVNLILQQPWPLPSRRQISSIHPGAGSITLLYFPKSN